MYIERSIKTYLDDLAARKPAPGGGSAAALSAATGVALISMVANYTVGNPKYKDAEKKIADLLVKAGNFRDELEELVDRDVEAYGKLSNAMKTLQKNSPELEKAYKEAAAVPFEICKIASECLRLCGVLAESGNKNLVTDTAIAAIMLEGAFLSAKFNVYINLKYMKDTAYIGTVHRSLSPLEGEMKRLKEEILERCEDVISK
ncbi:MAG: cyclodeaminase/cyclohydrolase family protein [Candidatus Omnitrophota bacterium]